MTTWKATILAALAGVCCLILAGCNDKNTLGDPPPAPVAQTPPSPDHHGPHEGVLIDLGRNHEFHVELLKDDTVGAVIAYMLDGGVKELRIDAEKILLVLTDEGETSTYELQAHEPLNGKASEYRCTDPAALETLHDDTQVKVRVTIGGTPYVGELKFHDH